MARKVGKGRKRHQKQGGKEIRGRGGWRPGAGRKPKGAKAGVPHVRRQDVPEGIPVHVTMRVAKGIWDLQAMAMRQVVFYMLEQARERLGTRVLQFSVQANHLHLIVETRDKDALGQAMKGLAGRLAKAINRRMTRSGQVFPDRYHAHVLGSPRQVRNAVKYVRDNTKKHAAQIGLTCEWELDPFAAGPCPKTFRVGLRRLIAKPRSSLFQEAWAALSASPAG